MARQKNGVNKSDEIRQLLKANPEIGAKEAIAALGAKGITISDNLYYFVKSHPKKRKGGRPKGSINKTTPAESPNGQQTPETGETTGSYFKRVFKENPSLLQSRSNDELLTRWLADHPGEKTVPENIKKHMANVKSILRQKTRKKKGGRPKQVEEAAPVAMATSVAVMQPKLVKIASKSLEGLEEQIDDCLTAAKKLDREGLDDVIRLLRNARNAVVWKLGA
jgi:hypothetical protein